MNVRTGANTGEDCTKQLVPLDGGKDV
eukprot:SAG11_NODE_17050_length_530_cov_0.693735_1_plen_26_part_10